MHLSTHYYVITLSEGSNALYEAFRNTIIDIRNGGFPVIAAPLETGAIERSDRDDRQIEALRATDRLFGECYRHDPLGLVVAGEKNLLDIFNAVTAYEEIIIGRIDGDYSATSPRDLGTIAWSVVREALSGLLDRTLNDLEIASKAGRTVCGLVAISGLELSGEQATLVVEEDYHLRGSIRKTDQSIEISQDVDVMQEIDDAVDAVIERVLESGGNVVFAPNGSLEKMERIVLLRSESDAPR